jgi:hypothetical protein
MSLLSLQIDTAKFKKYGLKKRQVNTAAREALEAMAREWHSRFLPLHFTADAYQRYGYTQRKGMGLDPQGRAFRRSTVGRKIRYKGHNLPLVFSGEGRMLALGPIRLRSSSKQARVALPGKFNLRHSKSRISMRDELTRILPEESRVLLEIGRARFRQVLQQPPRET